MVFVQNEANFRPGAGVWWKKACKTNPIWLGRRRVTGEIVQNEPNSDG
jgi:hypothetical protein